MKKRQKGGYPAASTFFPGHPEEGTAVSPEYRRWGFTGAFEGRGDATFAHHVATGEELRFGLEPWR